ncbi:tryptophan-rich sensory protein [Salinirubellus salinus]|jgi:tryptophan-rich sensory protein|uniref:Tryptophan-rich sensory protein n=1 Tax=Salinirubellus salinus TaxID=1364945 RepID=A0A9E7R2E8_9EURY|nr:TspO/MBR family protein [Salinirubellus salinus]UWM53588.1 tryptophan-rich sensory protein [Salinirubellus salinus]
MDTVSFPRDPRLRAGLELLGWIVLAQLAGLLGSLATFTAIDSWYATLVRPELAPPNWVFGPVWTTLYTLIGVAAWLVSRADYPDKRPAYAALGVQLVLNTAWSFVFFGAEAIGPALAVILVLLVAIVANIALFYRVDRRAGLLLLPYLAWVSFATYLNYGFWVLN